MQNILWRVKEAEETQFSQMQLLSEKLDSLDLDDPRLFEKLTKEEQETFSKMISGSEFSSIVELWKPWWMQSSRIVQLDATETEIEDSEFSSPLPVVPSPIPPLSSIYKKDPSPEMNFNLIDILYCYVYCQRIFDGQPYLDILEYMATFANVSSVIFKNKSFGSTNLVVATIFERMIEIKEKYPLDFIFSLFEDVERILDSKQFVVAALYDLVLIFSYFLEKFPKIRKDRRSLSPVVIEAAKKKVYFFFLWANQFEEQFLGLLRLDLQSEMSSKHQFFDSASSTLPINSNALDRKIMIQEIK